MQAARKKIGLIIYPMFCNWEIALTLATLRNNDVDVVTFAKDAAPVICEEGLTICPDKTFADFTIDDGYCCILLSGIGGNPDAVIYDNAYTDFLRRFKGRNDIVLAAISLAPALLGRTGLLTNKKFCVGMFEEDREELDFFEYKNQVRAPIVIDDNIIIQILSRGERNDTHS